MIEFGGIYYYLDIDVIEKMVYINYKEGDSHVSIEKTSKTFPDGTTEETVVNTQIPKIREIDAIKYDIIKECINIVLDADDQGDSALGAELALEDMQMAYKVAFNTLYNYGILKEKE